MPDDKLTVCDFCRNKQVIWRTEVMDFRQSSDKGYVRCRAELPVGTCRSCGAKSMEFGSDEILDAAFLEHIASFPSARRPRYLTRRNSSPPHSMTMQPSILMRSAPSSMRFPENVLPRSLSYSVPDHLPGPFGYMSKRT